MLSEERKRTSNEKSVVCCTWNRVKETSKQKALQQRGKNYIEQKTGRFCVAMWLTLWCKLLYSVTVTWLLFISTSHRTFWCTSGSFSWEQGTPDSNRLVIQPTSSGHTKWGEIVHITSSLIKRAEGSSEQNAAHMFILIATSAPASLRLIKSQLINQKSKNISIYVQCMCLIRHLKVATVAMIRSDKWHKMRIQ